MYQPYHDITKRLGPPRWWDEHGVPRYEPFQPSLCADIYARFAALLTIRCQGCGRLMPVAASWSIRGNNAQWDADGRIIPKYRGGLPDNNSPGFCDYGDAPWHGDSGQCSGTTMTTDVVAIAQFWQRNDKHEWERNQEHEFTYAIPEEP